MWKCWDSPWGRGRSFQYLSKAVVMTLLALRFLPPRLGPHTIFTFGEVPPLTISSAWPTEPLVARLLFPWVCWQTRTWYFEMSKWSGKMNVKLGIHFFVDCTNESRCQISFTLFWFVWGICVQRNFLGLLFSIASLFCSLFC